nr:MAG TPA: hypothetical protein [Bacteriophage sp.]
MLGAFPIYPGLTSTQIVCPTVPADWLLFTDITLALM